jgi:hypothetical protein
MPPPPPPAAAAPPTNAEAMPAAKPETLPPIDVGAWTRVGALIQGQDKSKLNDFKMDWAYAELHAGGKIHKNVAVTVNLNASMVDYSQGGAFVQLEDAIIQFDLLDEFHLWAGHLLVMADRANSAGPFFALPWNFLPGIYAVPATPHEGPTGRSNGAVVWGDIAKGKLTYIAGVYDNGNGIGVGAVPPAVGAPGSSPLFSGRLRLSLMDEEPGFWGNSSYFGDKDIFSIGLGGQYQKNGSTAGDKTWAEFNADVLFEKKLGGGSFFTAEGGYYHFNDDDLSASDLVYVLAAFATANNGSGNLQPMARFQWEKLKNAPSGTTNPWDLDIGLAYLIKGPALRVVANYAYTKLGSDVSANAIQLGAQAIFF